MDFIRSAMAAVVVAVASCAYAQAPETLVINVDYDSIRTVVTERPEQFRALTARFMDADTTLTPSEVAVVYYGHAFTPTYNPDEKYADVLEALGAGDLPMATILADEALRRNPVSLPMLFKLYGCCAASDLERIKGRCPAIQARIFMLCDMITSSGLGVTELSPWAVISEADIDEILAKYMYVQRELERSDKGNEKAVKVRMEGVPDDVILYFDLTLPRQKKSRN